MVGRAEAEVCGVSVKRMEDYIDVFQIIQGFLQYLSLFRLVNEGGAEVTNSM